MTKPPFIVLFREQTVPLVDQIWVGRDPSCNIVVTDDPKVSRKHARFMLRGTVVTIEDHASANGTFLNGARVITPLRVNPGDEVRVGDERLALQKVGATPAPRRTGRPPRDEDQVRESQRYTPPDLETEPYGVDRYHVRWLQIEDAVASKDWALADDLLAAQFRRVRRDIEESGELLPITQAKLCRHALDVAVATGDGSWINALLDLHTWLRQPLPDASAEALPSVVVQVRGLDVSKLRGLIGVLRATPGDELEDEARASIEFALEVVEGQGR